MDTYLLQCYSGEPSRKQRLKVWGPLDGVKQQLGVDLQLAFEHQALERLPAKVAELDSDAFAHLPVGRKDGTHVILEVDQVPLEPVEPVVDLRRAKAG